MKGGIKMYDEKKGMCSECHQMVDKGDLCWINDNYGIPFKRVCSKCFDKVEKYIRNNNYGDELTHDELYGEDY